MKKVFLYLYPIEEYTKMFLFHDDFTYDKLNIQRPLPVIDKCIQERYRNQEYEVVFVLYPDRELFGLTKKKQDRIIFADISFDEASAIDINGNVKEKFTPKYPDEMYILKQLGNIDKLVVGGYHANDCVKRMAEASYAIGIDTLIDLDLTDLFFSVYKNSDYFRVAEYSPQHYYEYIKSRALEEHEDNFEEIFRETFSSDVYGFFRTNCKLK